MLYLIEARCMGWEHEQVNAGFVAQLRQACPDESICFFADAGHLRCVNSIYGLEQGQVRACATSFPSKYEDCKEEARRYAAILVQILNNAGPDLTDVFLLSCCDGIALAVSALAPRYKVRFHLVFHARLERMLNRERRREQLFRQGEDPGEPTRLRTILEQMDDRSVELICYSPFYRRYLPGYLAPACIRRMIFLHHPFVQHAVTPTRHENAGLRIGVYAAAANDNACQVVRAVAERDPAGAVSFALLGGKQNPLEKEPSVERVLPGQRLSAGTLTGLWPAATLSLCRMTIPSTTSPPQGCSGMPCADIPRFFPWARPISVFMSPMALGWWRIPLKLWPRPFCGRRRTRQILRRASMSCCVPAGRKICAL